MSDAMKELQKLMVRRKQDGGEFSYVLIPDGEPIAGKKAALTNLKEDKSEEFSEMKALCKTAEETDESFDRRLLGILPKLPFEQTSKDDMSLDHEGKRNQLSGADMFRVVRVDGVDRIAAKDEVETFFKAFEGVDMVKDAGKKVKAWREPGPAGKGRQKPLPGRCYDITFKDEKSAKAFLEKEDEVVFKEQAVKTWLLKDIIQARFVRSQFRLTFSRNLRMMDCIPMDKGKEDTYIMVYGIGRPTEEELKQYFMGVESEFENIVSVKIVLQNEEEDTDRGKLRGVLVQFESKAALAKFMALKDVKFKEKLLRYNVMSELTRNNELRTKKANFVVDDGPTTQDLASRRLIVLRMKEEFSPEIEKKLKSLFPLAKDVRYWAGDKLTILTFPSAEAATKAVRNQDDGNDLVTPLNVMMLPEYLEIRGKILEEEADRIQKVKTKYENIKNSSVTVKGNVIKIAVPASPKMIKKEKEKEQKKNEKKDSVATKIVVKEVVVKQPPAHPILRKRMNRGSNVFDIFVGVRGFNQHIKNMGKATDMDVCNYFIHNHKDVADVKFVNWTEIVFAKFKTPEAAERFIALSYHMFYGIDLHLHDVPEFLKKKTDVQKEEVAKVLLSKKFNKAMLEGTGAPPVASTPAPKVEVPKTPEMELANFSSKQAGEGIRDILIENLHLDKDDVGQPRWVKASGDDGFKARFTIKLEENAIGYLVKKWNDLEITVAGETVKAELTSAKEGGAAKRGRRRPNNPDTKRAKLSPEHKLSPEDY